MTPARWQQIKAVLGDALECADPTERVALVKCRCEADPLLIAEVQPYLGVEDIDDEAFIRRCSGGLLPLGILPGLGSRERARGGEQPT
jgi:hypothetical protein